MTDALTARDNAAIDSDQLYERVKRIIPPME